MKKCLCAVLLVSISILPLSAQNGVSLLFSPGVDIPLGPAVDTVDADTPYSTGFSASVAGAFPLPSFSRLYGKAELIYGAVPTNDGVTETVPNLSLIAAGGGLGLNLLSSGKMSVWIDFAGGGYLGIWKNMQSASFYASGGAGFTYAIHPALGLGLGASYRHFFGPENNLYQGLSASVAARYFLGAGSRSRIQLDRAIINPVFPVLYHYFVDHPLGTVSIQNEEAGAVRNMQISFYVKQYMEEPTLCARVDELKKGEQRTVPLFALFSDAVMSITEGTKVAGQILIEYEYSGAEIRKEFNQSIEILYRNAMTWDDDRKAASFVTAKDPAVLLYAKNVAGTIRNSSQQAVNSNFRQAVAVFEALGLSGLNYIVDPASSYSDLSEDSFSLDYLQFPSETLSYRAGDCDDLSILYTALLEAVGIETAFITVPGHIYSAFSLDMPEDEARRLFQDGASIIVHEGNAWIPVETTMVGRDFLSAWSEGARQWQEYAPEQKTGFFPVHEAWTTYRPVAGPGSGTGIQIPGEAEISGRYEVVLTTFVEREIAPQVEELNSLIKSRRNNAPYYNRLGVLYARFGMYDKALENFDSAIRSGQYNPSRINYGNILFLTGDFENALTYYESALKIEPDNAKALIGAARSNYELKNMGTVTKLMDRLRVTNPQEAARFSYLTGDSAGTSRASDVMRKEVVIWDE